MTVHNIVDNTKVEYKCHTTIRRFIDWLAHDLHMIMNVPVRNIFLQQVPSPTSSLALHTHSVKWVYQLANEVHCLLMETNYATFLTTSWPVTGLYNMLTQHNWQTHL